MTCGWYRQAAGTQLESSSVYGLMQRVNQLQAVQQRYVSEPLRII